MLYYHPLILISFNSESFSNYVVKITNSNQTRRKKIHKILSILLHQRKDHLIINLYQFEQRKDHLIINSYQFYGTNEKVI